ncbi:MAG: TonB-dependent receptor [Cytophagales bacterium]|nr:TonB-dependent receptor [Cytophaga sp.]
MKLISTFYFFIAFSIAGIYAQTNYTISGKVLDSAGVPIIGAIIKTSNGAIGTATDTEGDFSLKLPQGTYTLVISYFGYVEQQKQVVLNKNVILNISMTEDIITTEVIVITEDMPNQNVVDTKMGVTELTIEEVKKLPALFGEVDIVKNIQTLPGVQVAGDGNTGLYVRGGGADQNLILIDEAPVYNASHLFGIFSIFNADVVKGAELYKAGIPSQHGGRLSSMLDVTTRNKPAKKFGGQGGLGTIVSRLTLEGTFDKGKGSYMIAGRRSYVDLYLQLSPNPDTRRNKLFFYDLNGKVNYQFNKKNSLYLASYYGKDVFKFGNTFSNNWGNFTVTANWLHTFSDRVFLNTIYTHSDYKFDLGIDAGAAAFDFKTGVSENAVKQDYQILPNSRHHLHIGWSVAQRAYNPGIFSPTTDASIFKEIATPAYHSLEGALFISNKQRLTEKLSIDYGLRFNIFSNVGTGRVYSYAGSPVTTPITDTTYYNKGEVIKTYTGFEPRFAVRYLLNEQSSVKVGFNRNIQYIHLISNSLAPVPFNVWVPSNDYFKPESVNQYSAGYFRNLKDNAYETSVEAYYKDYQNSIDFIDNANLLLNQNIESQVYIGKAWSYGAEFFLKKKQGKLTGWISYTLSWSYKKIPGINNGEKYFAGYDRRQSLNIVAGYQISKRVSLGGNFVFGTGRPMGLPASGYDMDYFWLGVYPARNSFRLPSYHRLDLSLTLDQRKKEGRKWEGSWNFSIYNVYGMFHINPWTVITKTDPDTGDRGYYAIYFPAPIPSVTYNFKF